MTERTEGSDASLEKGVVDYYHTQQLSSDRLHAILSDTQSRQRKRNIGVAIAASIVLMSMILLVHQNILVADRKDVVLREAALNHTSKMRMDAEAASIEELQAELLELPFKMKIPESAIFKELALVGGRYCTISGNLAAHLKLSNKETEQQYSLFLTPTAENLDSMQITRTEISGISVKLWQEDDVVYALATSADKLSGESL